jgi:MIP family channel proteins
MSQTMKASLAEFIGVFFFVFIGAGAICTDAITHGSVGLVGIALAHGLMMAINIAALGHISGGHFNPAVTIALATINRISVRDAAAYVASQLLGAGVAGFALKSIFPSLVTAAPFLGATLPGNGIDAQGALLIEVVLTIVLLTAVYGTAVAPGGPRGVVPFAVGLAIAVDILAAGPLSGASMNPARTMGPVFATGNTDLLWIYWVGPVLGALAAVWIYDALLAPAAAPRPGAAGTRARAARKR